MAITPGMKDIVQDIISSHDVRAAEVKGLRKEANEMLDSFKTSHKEMGTELRKSLAQGETERKEGSAELKKELTQGVATLKSDVKGMLNDFQSSHQELSTELKKNLAQGEADRKQASAELKKELTDYVRGMKSEVAGMRQVIRADLKEARTTWQGMTQAMEAKGAGVKVPPKVEVPAAEEKIPDLEAKLLAAVRKHPMGITLAEVAESLGVVPVVLGRASRSLLERGLIRKEEKLYFPVASE